MTDELAGTTKPQIELHCRVNSSMLGLLREFVCSVARHMGFSDQQVGEIEICVDEACANAVEHAYPSSFQKEFPGADHDLRIEISYLGDELTVRITDHGRGSEETLRPRFEE